MFNKKCLDCAFHSFSKSRIHFDWGGVGRVGVDPLNCPNMLFS